MFDWQHKNWKFRLRRLFHPAAHPDRTCILKSSFLNRDVLLDFFIPSDQDSPWSLLLLNDGQDLSRMGFHRIYRDSETRPALVVGIHAGDRMQEYGVAGHPGHRGLGVRADRYARFIVQELLPLLHRQFPLQSGPEHAAVAGFSLGGLSAFDLAWNHADHFGMVGVFSGSLWMRSKAFDAANPDANRIAHEMVARSRKRPDLQFWFQAGTDDETDDRNGNGIIDAIDDTLQLMEALQAKGFPAETLAYREVEGGRHDVPTWGQVMPEFLSWAFPKQAQNEQRPSGT